MKSDIGLAKKPLFCNRFKEKLTRAGITYIFNKHVNAAKNDKPELFPEKVYPHIFRHSRAMHWLETGIEHDPSFPARSRRYIYTAIARCGRFVEYISRLFSNLSLLELWIFQWIFFQAERLFLSAGSGFQLMFGAELQISRASVVIIKNKSAKRQQQRGYNIISGGVYLRIFAVRHVLNCHAGIFMFRKISLRERHLQDCANHRVLDWLEHLVFFKRRELLNRVSVGFVFLLFKRAPFGIDFSAQGSWQAPRRFGQLFS